MEKCQVSGNRISEEPKQGLWSCTVCACPAKPLGSTDPMTRKEYDQAMLTWSKNLYGQSGQPDENLGSVPEKPVQHQEQAAIVSEIEADPGILKVITVKVPEPNNRWFQVPVKIMRWQQLV